MKKINFSLSRQNLYLLILSVILLIFVLIFSFSVLIPEGKKYREKRAEVKKENSELKVHKDFNEETEEVLKDLRNTNRHVIAAFANTFDQNRFKKLHGKYFSELHILKAEKQPTEEGFSLYEVKTVSKINSPKAFYDFLDSLNKTEWIISVNFPINFKRDDDLISSSFTMKVYSNPDDNSVEKIQKD
jgi:lipopolysaccharide export LptBFGC system permease protein LptF